MGSQKDSVDVIFDTASDWLSVEGNICENCEGNTFAVTFSNTADQVSSETSERSYGGTLLTGWEYTDRVCVTTNDCVNDFEFFLISK